MKIYMMKKEKEQVETVKKGIITKPVSERPVVVQPKKVEVAPVVEEPVVVEAPALPVVAEELADETTPKAKAKRLKRVLKRQKLVEDIDNLGKESIE